MAEDVTKMISMLGNQMNNVTEKLLGMESSLTNIQENIAEIKVKNGGGIEVTMKTNELLKNLYEQTKTGGIIDEKFKKCKDDHSTQKRLGIFDKKSAVWFNVGYRIVVVLVIGYMFLKMLDFETVITNITALSK